MRTSRDNDIRAVTSLPHHSQRGGPEPQLSESRALSKEAACRSAPPAMGCGPSAVALCLLAAGGAAHRGNRVRLALLNPRHHRVLSHVLSQPQSFFPTGLVDSGVTQTPRYLIKARGQPRDPGIFPCWAPLMPSGTSSLGQGFPVLQFVQEQCCWRSFSFRMSQEGSSAQLLAELDFLGADGLSRVSLRQQQGHSPA